MRAIESIGAVQVPNYDKDVLVPLRAAQAQEAAAALAAQEAAQAALVAQQAADAAAAAQRVRQVVYVSQSYYGNSYTPGQCTFLVASRISVPQTLGDARNWGYGLLAAGWHQGGPAAGEIAQTTAGYYGHVAIVVAVGNGIVEIEEMNGPGGPYVIDYRWVNTGDFNYFYR